MHRGYEIYEIMGSRIDAIKLRSSMTLFDLVSPNDLFGDVLNSFFEGRRDSRTIALVEQSIDKCWREIPEYTLNCENDTTGRGKDYKTEVYYVEYRDDQKWEYYPRTGDVGLMNTSLLDPAEHMERIGEADKHINGV